MLEGFEPQENMLPYRILIFPSADGCFSEYGTSPDILAISSDRKCPLPTGWKCSERVPANLLLDSTRLAKAFF
jgi:hypothetical protein